MPKVSINIIKDWFKNQSKPPQEQFWAWLDSFWHKDEPIPQSAVENLVPNLQKKADLVDGVVPESQLPFSVVTSEVIALGSVTIDGDKVNLPVHSSGVNTVRVKGRTITRTFPNQWTFTPIADNGVKVMRGYAVKTEDDFFLAEGPELPEYEQPEIPADALELFEFTVTSEGATLIEQDLTAYKLKANDAWVRNWVNYTTDIQTLSIHHAALRFIVKAGHDSVKIGGFNFYKPEFLYDGVEITLRNETLGELELATVAASGNTIPINPADLPAILKIGESCTLAYDVYANVFNVQKMGGGGGSASFPEAGNDGDTLEKDSTAESGVKWSDRLTTVETDKQDKSMFSALVDKWIHYYDSTTQKMQPILKFVSGVVNQLEFTGRIKADALVLPANSNTVVPNRLRSDGSRLKYANDLGTEKDIAYLDDVYSSSMLLQRYVHNSNTELYPTNVDYATGSITVPNHGLTIGAFINGGIVPNRFKTENYITTTDWKSIPYEWTNSAVRVLVIDVNTLQLSTGGTTAITVNPSSTENNGSLDFSKWHIEIFSLINMANIPMGVKNIRILMNGYISSGGQTSLIFKVFLFNSDGTSFQNNINVPDNLTGNSNDLNLPANGSNNGFFHYTAEVKFSTYRGTNGIIVDGAVVKRAAGASSFPSTRIYTGNYTWMTRAFLASENSGFAKLSTNVNTLFNGTVIEIYRQ